MPFKKGAFASLKAVEPLVLVYDKSHLNPAYDVMPLFPHLIIYLSQLYSTCRILRLPTFEPTAWMYENHKDKGKEDWEIYAQCVREAMAKAGGLGINN